MSLKLKLKFLNQHINGINCLLIEHLGANILTLYIKSGMKRLVNSMLIWLKTIKFITTFQEREKVQDVLKVRNIINDEFSFGSESFIKMRLYITTLV